MLIAQVRSIASLKRGLEILSVVSAHDGMSLHALHGVSAVPKASLLRILKTLIEHRLVRKREGDGAYLVALHADVQPAAPHIPDAALAVVVYAAMSRRAVPTARSTQGTPVSPPGRPKGAYRSAPHEAAPMSGHRLVDGVAQMLADLRTTLIFPSDVAVLHGHRMRVIDSNRTDYGRAWRPSVIGEEVDMLDSAMGRAYLAFSLHDVRRPMIDALLAPGGTRARRREALERELQATRQRGFAARDHLYAGPDTHHGRQLSAVAVPILMREQVVACVSCVWSIGASSRAEVIEQSLAHLVRGACQLGTRLEE